ncbi:ArdC family protein, partial [Sphingobium chungbukense]
MSVPKRSSRDVAAEITNLIIRKLEEGVPPWSRPWRWNGAGGRPLRHCGTPYQGINVLYLWAIGDAQGYRSRYWMTYRQAEALGGHVRKGEAGSISVYYSSFKKREEHPETGQEVERSIRFLRHYIVFNADQIDGLPAYFYPPVEPEQPIVPSERQAAIDAFFAAIPADVRHGGNRAYFTPTFDHIQLPNRTAFRSMDHYASTRCHETVHWSGHASRLARTFGKRFGDKAYAFEELVAL